jgi:hypothetical protein
VTRAMDLSLRVRADYMFDIKSGALLRLEDRHPSGHNPVAVSRCENDALRTSQRSRDVYDMVQ